MTYPIINPSAEQQQAWRQWNWDEACSVCEQLPKAFSTHDARALRLRERVTFADQAVAVLGALNDFDLRKVLEDIVALTEQSAPCGVFRYWRNPQIRMTSTEPFQGRHHYLIDYVVVNGRIAVRDVFLNEEMLGMQPDTATERTALYRVRRDSGSRFKKPAEKKDIDNLRTAWVLDGPTSGVATEYAAINGMRNPLDKAVWLMGVHLDNAYSKGNPDAYTLLHNPSRSKLADLAECIWDKLPFDRSEPAQYLSAVLRQRQNMGVPTHWVAHSQGAIIFHAAVRLHIQRNPTPLNFHRIAIHGSGAFLPSMRDSFSRVGINIVHVRNNPFDLVPNIAGSNDLCVSSLYRSLRFSGLIFGENGGNCALSPHTLPYLGVHNYKKQLELAGEARKAERVAQYIERRNIARHQRRLK